MWFQKEILLQMYVIFNIIKGKMVLKSGDKKWFTIATKYLNSNFTKRVENI